MFNATVTLIFFINSSDQICLKKVQVAYLKNITLLVRCLDSLTILQIEIVDI